MPSPRQCLKCRNTYANGEEFCPLDGTQLSPAQNGPPREADPMLGRVIAGRFVLTQFVGGGTMGVVYRAVHQVLERPFAVKLLRREFIDDERALKRFFREAKAASTVEHSNIVRMHDFGQTEDKEPYLVMEHVQGTTLYHAMYQTPTRNLPLGRAIDILLQVARALAHAHARGVIHRDIKPENILLTEVEGQEDWVKILDFGVAKIVGLPPLSLAGEVLGTPEFIPPEALSGAAEVAAPADLYALGVMVHDTIVGKPPFQGDLKKVLQQHVAAVPALLSQRRFDIAIPSDLDLLAARLLEKEPGRRPSAPETVNLLEQIRASLPPRSLRSLLLAQTLILPAGQRQEKFNQARTMILPPPEQRGAAPAGAEIPRAQLLRAALQTVVSSAMLREIDVLEDERLRVSGRLSELCGSLLHRLWPKDAPQEVGALLAEIRQCEETELELGTELALLQEQIEQRRRQVQAQQETRRRQVIELSERRQQPGLREDERQAITRDIEEQERAFFALEQDLADHLPAQQLAAARQRLQEAQGELHKLRGRLARSVLSAAFPAELSAERRRLEQLVTQLDAATAMLSMLVSQEAKPA